MQDRALTIQPRTAFDRRAIPASATVDRIDAPDGWRLRRIRWTAPDGPVRGSLMFLGGRGDHYEKYLETFEDWRVRGWQVTSIDWRGQGGSGRTTANPHVGHIDDFAVWIDDCAHVFAQWQRETPGPHVIAGHSMGGHLVLRALAEHRIAPDAAILVAPMLGFLAPYPDWLGEKVAGLMCRIGDPARPAWKISEKPGSPLAARRQLLTHDAARYDDEQWWHEAAPETLLGPGSWGWVLAAYRSFLGMAQPGVVEGVTTTVLMLVARHDGLVSSKAAVRDAARLPDCTLHVYGREAAHELLREADGVRNDALARIDAFLDRTVPQP